MKVPSKIQKMSKRRQKLALRRLIIDQLLKLYRSATVTNIVFKNDTVYADAHVQVHQPSEKINISFVIGETKCTK